MAPAQSKVMCIWLNQKKEPCPWQRMSENCDFCKRHSKYNGIYTKDDIPNLTWCSGCPNVFRPIDGEQFKQCLPCRNRGASNRVKIKENSIDDGKKCVGIIGSQKEKETGTGHPCTKQALSNDEYCGKCQSYKKWKQLTDSGNKVCKDWVRGCFEIILDKYQKCQNCRCENQIKENNLAKKKLQEANDYDKSHNKTKMCINCSKTDDTDKITNRKCINCYDIYKKVESNRKPTNPLIRKLSDCKTSAKGREIEWNISDELAIKLIQSKCNYCDKLVTLNGIDRINSNISYVESNVVSCCGICNIMKNTHSVENFIKIVTYLLAINCYIDVIPDDASKKLFEFSKSGNFSHFKCDAVNKDKSINITENMYNSIVSQPCNYCKNSSKIQNNVGARGIDRINSTFGYIPGNIVPCCKTCNCIKSNLSVTEFFQHLLEIYNYSVLNITNEMLSLPEQIINLCNTVKELKPEKFLKDQSYYKNLMFNSTKISDVENIKIELEFVRDKNQRDIWNYFRRHVSSLNKQHNAKLIGRQFYILVKDLTSNKYLGIISLSSDLQNLQHRDDYIGWNTRTRTEKLDYLMNISTCVPLQPFGFNFNGGKLLASLVFSKEVLTHFYNSYGHELLGITTTSLYGKSIQYDRLQCLKYMGLTKGNSVKDIPSEVTKLCSEYLKCEYNQNYPPRKKYIILMSAFNKLGLSKEDLLKSNEKGIYFGFTHQKSQDFLLDKLQTIPTVRESAQTATEIFQWWLDRWASQRQSHLKKNKRLKTQLEIYLTKNDDNEELSEETSEQQEIKPQKNKIMSHAQIEKPPKKKTINLEHTNSPTLIKSNDNVIETEKKPTKITKSSNKTIAK